MDGPLLTTGSALSSKENLYTGMTRYPARLAIVCAAFIVTCYAMRLSLLPTRTFDPDELQHVHAAWAVHQGLVPFRDFFEHHMPGIQFMLAPVLGQFHVEDTPDDAIRFLFVARTLMWIFAGLVVALTVLLGMLEGGAAVGWLSGGLLTTSIVFMSRTLEIRPDTPALALWLASLFCVAMAVKSGSDADRRPRRLFIAGGFFFGCALVFNQKLLLAGPGLLLFAALRVRQQSTRRRRAPTLDGLSFVAASAAPLFALLAYFWYQGAAADFVRGVLITNLGWPREVSAGSTLNWMLLRDPWLMAVAVAGAVQAGIEMGRERSASLRTALLLFPSVSLVVGMFFVPTPYPQYMLQVLPAGAILGARFVWALCNGLSERTSVVRRFAVDRLIVAASAFVVAAIGIYVARPFFLHRAAYPALGVATIIGVALLTSLRKVEWAAVVLLCACSAYTIQQLRWMQGESNADALRDMRYIHAMTQPTDRVLDGFSGLSWFRPHASFYPFLHPGVRDHLSAQEAAGVAEILAKCAGRPKLVILDEHLIRISPAIAPLVSQFYEPSRSKLVWVRKAEACHDNGSEGAERASQ